MRTKLWSFDTVVLDLEDRDCTVTVIHNLSLAEVTVKFRLTTQQLRGSPQQLRRNIEVLAADKLLDLASFLDSQRPISDGHSGS